jgi:hypothetical protein
MWATIAYQPITENKIKISEPFVLPFGMCWGHGLLLARVSRQLGFYEVLALRLTLNLGAMVSSFSGTWLKTVAGKGRPTSNQAVAIFCFDHFYYRIT